MKTPAQKLYEYWALNADDGTFVPVWEEISDYQRHAWRMLWEKVPELLRETVCVPPPIQQWELRDQLPAPAPDLEQMDRDLAAAWEKGREFQRMHPDMTELAPENSGAQHHRNCPLRTGRGAQCGC